MQRDLWQVSLVHSGVDDSHFVIVSTESKSLTAHEPYWIVHGRSYACEVTCSQSMNDVRKAVAFATC